MTAPASWIVYDAMNDFFFRAVDGVLRFNPMLDGTMPLVHPLFWAKASRDGGRFSVEIVRTWGEYGARSVRAIEVPAEAGAVEMGGAPLERVSTAGVYAAYALPSPMALAPGLKIEYCVKA